MSTTDTSAKTIDLTKANGTELVEVLTPGGTVRVYIGMVNVQNNRPAVLVEVTPNSTYHQETKPGGDWETDVQENLPNMRTDVVLTKRAEK